MTLLKQNMLDKNACTQFGTYNEAQRYIYVVSSNTIYHSSNFLHFFHFKTSTKAKMKVNMPFSPPVELYMPDLMLSESMGTTDLIFRTIMCNTLSQDVFRNLN